MVDIVKSFTDAWNIYVKNFFTILLSTLVVVFLGIITIGILYVPLLVGLQMLFVKAKRGEPIALADIFVPMKKFLAVSFATVWIAILCVIGFILLIVPGLCWSTWWMFALLFIVDKNLGIGAGMKASKDVVRKNNLWMHLLLLILSGIVAHLGTYVYGVGVLLTMPLGMGAIACAYADESK